MTKILKINVKKNYDRNANHKIFVFNSIFFFSQKMTKKQLRGNQGVKLFFFIQKKWIFAIVPSLVSSKKTQKTV